VGLAFEVCNECCGVVEWIDVVKFGSIDKCDEQISVRANGDVFDPGAVVELENQVRGGL
jgi:hypothetical protein